MMEHGGRFEDFVSTAERLRKRAIPPLKGRPDRERPITSEDVADLMIALNTSTSLEEFLYSV